MPQIPSPWYRRQTGWWMAQVNRKQEKLVKGPKDAATKRLAQQKLFGLLAVADSNPAPESVRRTVASVIETYLKHAAKAYAPRSLYERKLVLQSFAEAHGWREVNDKDCIPFHLTSWLDAHPEWESDWTKAHMVATVLRPFNWAVRQRLIPANPFRGVSHRPGPPRRPMTDVEFETLLQAAEGRKTKHYPSPADRFRELLRFLRLTGARPGEASGLRWDQVDCEAGGRTVARRRGQGCREGEGVARRPGEVRRGTGIGRATAAGTVGASPAVRPGHPAARVPPPTSCRPGFATLSSRRPSRCKPPFVRPACCPSGPFPGDSGERFGT
jgi:hypothetical protein